MSDYNAVQEVNMMMLKDKVALVTGGASGIGRATSLSFANATYGKLDWLIGSV